ncbi:hypothetical protein C9374_010770 [Naegleria lovaniensis]|uniref:F-box domain-containing protein n=1 Tax=Naegleria lovaniensis TaxID=51637 RepID=A0AA88GDF6_NAELO|nr:uncharacterized protein C9374_010770 [Naegleria lovaniensis]KAG2374486.1 hypothetical protein C9374_010770 [Naegleria lovaniensis]
MIIPTELWIEIFKFIPFRHANSGKKVSVLSIGCVCKEWSFWFLSDHPLANMLWYLRVRHYLFCGHSINKVLGNDLVLPRLVRKNLQFCVDFQFLNQVLRNDCYESIQFYNQENDGVFNGINRLFHFISHYHPQVKWKQVLKKLIQNSYVTQYLSSLTNRIVESMNPSGYYARGSAERFVHLRNDHDSNMFHIAQFLEKLHASQNRVNALNSLIQYLNSIFCQREDNFWKDFQLPNSCDMQNRVTRSMGVMSKETYHEFLKQVFRPPRTWLCSFERPRMMKIFLTV